MNAVVGNLQVKLGLDLGQYEAGWKKASDVSRRGAQAIQQTMKSAEESAQVFLQADRAAKQLIASIDPLYAAQLRYNNSLEQAQKLFRQGSLNAAEFAKVQSGLKSQLDQQTQAFSRVGGVAGSARIGMQQLGFQLNDIAQGFALGTRPMTIFAQQGSQVIQSLQLMGGEGNKFLNFLKGPWGIALTIAGVALGPLIAKLFQTGEGLDDLVDKLRKEADETRRNEAAQKAFALTLEGVTDAIRKNAAALRDLGDAHDSAARKAAINAAQAKRTLEDLRKQTELELAEAKRNVETQQALASLPGADPTATAQAMARALAEVSRLEQKLKDIQTQSKAAAKQFQEAISFRVVELGQEDEVGRIKRKYDDLIEAARRRALAEHKTGDELYRQTRALEAQRAAAIKAVQDRNKGDHFSNRETGKEITAAEAASIARAAGLVVNSAGRTFEAQKKLYDAWVKAGRPADNPVAVPGTSAHEGAKGRWALDIQLAKGVTPELLRKVFAAQGVTLSKVFKERGHFHVEGSRSQASAAETAADRAESKRVAQDDEFARQSASIDEQILRARRELLTGSEKQAEYAKQQIAIDQRQFEISTQRQVDSGAITDLQRKELLEKRKALVIQQAINAALADRQRLLHEDILDQEAVADRRTDQLEFERDIATTSVARRQIELDLIDISFDIKKAKLEEAKAAADLAGNTRESARLQAEINDLQRQKGNAQTRARLDTQGPLGSYLKTIPGTADEIDQKVEGLMVDELEAVRQGIDDAIMNVIGVKDPFLAGIIDLFVQEVLIRPIAQALQAHGGGSGLGVGGFFSKLLGIGVSAAAGVGGGGVLGPHAEAAALNLGAFASGGFTGRMPVNKIAGFVHGREYVFDAEATKRIGVGNLEAIRKGFVKPANDRMMGGDVYNMPINIHSRMTPREARETAAQAASAFQNRVAQRKRQGY